MTSTTLRCTIDDCPCDVYRPTKLNLRQCDSCKHRWMSHVLEQQQSSNGVSSRSSSSVVAEQPTRPSTVCEIASLILYGVRAVPIRLKILLDRLLVTLNETDIDDLLRSLGWTWEDYTRGYMANIHQQESSKCSINRWLLCNSEEEKILQHFLNLTETRSFATQMINGLGEDSDNFCSDSTTQTPASSASFNNNRTTTTNGSGSSSITINPLLGSASLFSSSASSTNFANCGNLSSSTANYQKFFQHQNSVMNRMMVQNLASNRCTPFYTIDNYRCSSIGIPVLPSNSFGNNDFNCSDDSSLMSPSNSCPGAPSPENHCSSSLSQATSPNVSISDSVTRRSLATPVLPSSNVQPTVTNRSRSANAILSGADDDRRDGSTVEDSDDQEEAEDLSMKKNLSKFVNAQKINQSTSIGQFYSPVSLYYSKTLRNVRKTALKRLHPSSLAQLGTNPLTGKKRVQCRVCLKTFCDKGALKIHISAVHLREMHQCTVAGCNMVFSSRRSRNRHSGNPNPKLHTPTYRRNSLPGSGCRVISPPSAAEEYRRMIAELEEPSRGSKKSLEKLSRSSWDPADDHFDTVSKSDTGSSVTTPTDESPRGVRKRKSDHPTKFKHSSSSFNVVDNERHPQRKMKFNSAVVARRHKSPSPAVIETDIDAERPTSVDDEEKQPANQVLEVLDCTNYQPLVEDSTTAINHLANMTQSLGRNSVPIGPQLEPTPMLLCAEARSPATNVAVEDVSPVGNVSSRCKTPSTSSNVSDVPLDEDNPRKCSACGKIFQNHFSVKTHYQNVHLKLMHKCTVDGCNAKFPSKRSRDRHSANQNLHRKLLSTSRDPSPSPTNSILSSVVGKVANFRPEFLPGQLYPFGAPPVLPFGVPGLLNPFWARMAATPMSLPNPFYSVSTSDASSMLINHNQELLNGSLNLSKKSSVERNSSNSPVSTKAETVK